MLLLLYHQPVSQVPGAVGMPPPRALWETKLAQSAPKRTTFGLYERA